MIRTRCVGGIGTRTKGRRGALSRVSPSGFSEMRDQGLYRQGFHRQVFYLPFHTLTHKTLSHQGAGVHGQRPCLPPPPLLHTHTGCPHQGAGVCGRRPYLPPPLHRTPSPRHWGVWPVPSPPAARTRCWPQSQPQQRWPCPERMLTSHSSSAPRWGRVPFPPPSPLLPPSALPPSYWAPPILPSPHLPSSPSGTECPR